MAEWLRLPAPAAGGLGVNPSRGTRSHRLQQEFACCHEDQRMGAATKPQSNQINIFKKTIEKIKETKRSLLE